MKFFLALLAATAFLSLVCCTCRNTNDKFYEQKTENFRKVCDRLRSYIVERKPTSKLSQVDLDVALFEVNKWDSRTSMQAQFCEPAARIVIAMLRFQKESLHRGDTDKELKKFERYYRLLRPAAYEPEYNWPDLDPKEEDAFDDEKKLLAALRSGQSFDNKTLADAYKSYMENFDTLDKSQAMYTEDRVVGFDNANQIKSQMEYKFKLIRYMYEFPVLNSVIFPQYMALDQKMSHEEAKRLYNQEFTRMGYKYSGGKVEFLDENFIKELGMDSKN